ncbi:major facilitator superfamily MFS-1 domain containing protein [Elysia marginata]|uniref:Major facilitator superfamily MFS-1 domain containing protein n=1 Tax=Elysia marginata TaxID=1093978 RepID=A0AAV4G3T7_9GAST|nr:major facilitator superfamily MFS-1 domain containing protein [Elysia marginata]
MRPNYRKALVLVGTFLNAFPLSLQSYFGNLLPYIDSYYYAYREQIGFHVDPLWTSSVFVCSFILGMIVSSPIERRLGLHQSILATDICLSLALLLGYFTVKEPLALALVFGGSQGTFVGIVYSMMMKLLLLTMTEHKGLATGIMSAGPVFGALIFVGVSYVVINPYNKIPDLEVDNKAYFSDKDLVDRVPYYFLVVGAMTAAFTFIGMTLIYLGSWKYIQNQLEENVEESSLTCNKEDCANTDSTPIVSSDEEEAVPVNATASREHSKIRQDTVRKTKKCKQVSSSNNVLARKIQREEFLEDKRRTKPRAISDASPQEAIKTARFWLVWLAYVSSNHTNYLHLNLYKRYGQRVILDDSLLVTAGIISNAGMVVVRPLVGIASDRFGIRGMNVYLNAASCLFMSLMVLVLHTCPWLYVVLVVVEYMGVSPHTMLFSLLTAYEFGKTHCGSNMGLIRSGNILLVLLEPVFVDALIRAIGWDWLFLTGSLTSLVATMAVLALDFF